jgi:hypothetical protein
VDAITEDAAARVLLVEAPAVVGWSRWRAPAASGGHLPQCSEGEEGDETSSDSSPSASGECHSLDGAEQSEDVDDGYAGRPEGNASLPIGGS